MQQPLFRRHAQFAVLAAGAALALGPAAFAAPRVQPQSIQVNPRGPIVTGLTLIDADTNRPVRGYDPIPAGATLNLANLPRHLNIRANTAGGVGSVRFDLDGGGNQLSSVRVESRAPFALCSNSGGNYFACAPNVLAPGSHRVSATPSSGANGSGILGSGVVVNFAVIRASAARPVTPPAVTSLTLIDADTNRPVRGYDPIPAGAVLRLSNLPRHLNVRANTSGTGSVVFSLDGASNHLENQAPFALCTDGRGANGKKGDYFGCGAKVFSPGPHRFTATPYPKMFAGGAAGQPLAWVFTVER